mmetsp:Transcript_29513/g.49617  ORF Transcript_29513/g.49617 Transcript_29513/m.49617 type:complete len:487 (-) Transcript_29513:115-1575(-)
MRLLGVTAGETTCALPMRVHALDGVRVSGHACSSSSVHRSRHTASVRFPLPTTASGSGPLRGNGYRYPHEHVAMQNQPVLPPKPFLPKYQRRPARIYTSNLANTTSQYCAQRLSSEWRDATRCERFNGSSRSRAPQRRSYRYSELLCRAMWSWEEEDGVEPEPPRTPRISKKLKRRVKTLWTRLNPLVAVFGKKNQIELLPFEEPLAELDRRIEEVRRQVEDTDVDVKGQIEAVQAIQELEKRAAKLTAETFSRLTPEQRRMVACHPARPTPRDCMMNICDKFMELHCDGSVYSDPYIVCGVGYIDGMSVLLIGYQKGWRYFEEKHFAESVMLMQQAESFGFPVVALIATHSTVPDEETEPAPAFDVLKDLIELKVPILRIVLGMACWTAPAAAAVGDRVLMMEHSVYFNKSKAGGLVQLQAERALEQGAVTAVVNEPNGGAHRHPAATYASIRVAIVHHLKELRVKHHPFLTLSPPLFVGGTLCK